MKKTLFINACVRPESRTYILAQHVLKKIGGQVEELNLEKENINPLNSKGLEIRDKYGQKGDFSHEIFKYARQFSEAERIVVAAPYWDQFSITDFHGVPLTSISSSSSSI